MKIRDANPKDFTQINKVFKQVDDLHSEAHPEIFNKPIDNARSNEYLLSILQNDKQKLIVAVEDTEIIGLAKADIESSKNIPLYRKREWLSINTIVVDKRYRGKGTGKMLLDKLYEWAKTYEVDEVELTVFSFNEDAIKFYEKNGFNDVTRKMHRKIGE